MMNSSKSRLIHVPPIALAVSLAGVYLLTIAPGLTWANDGSDGGDLITAAATGGIAHPTGYPLYLLLARLFQLLPVGSLAFRTNLMSAIMTALAAVLVYIIVTRSWITSGAIQAWPAGLAAGYAFGLAPLIWSQAVITEVYALQSCLVLVILYLYIQPVQTSIPAQKRQDRWRGLWLGLAMGNHLTTLLLIPVALWMGSFRRKDDAQVISTSRFDLFRSWRSGWLFPTQTACLDGYGIVHLSTSPGMGTGSSIHQLGKPNYAGPPVVVGLRAVVSKLLSADQSGCNLGTPPGLGGSIAGAVWHAWAGTGSDRLNRVWRPVTSSDTYIMDGCCFPGLWADLWFC